MAQSLRKNKQKLINANRDGESIGLILNELKVTVTFCCMRSKRLLSCMYTLFILVNVLAPVTEVTPVPHSLRNKTERPNDAAFLSIFNLKTNILVLTDKNWSLIG